MSVENCCTIMNNLNQRKLPHGVLRFCLELKVLIRRANCCCMFAGYENVTKTGNPVNCTDDSPRPDADEPCMFDFQGLRENCSEVDDYGYSTGQPCVLLKLNKVGSGILRPDQTCVRYDLVTSWIKCVHFFNIYHCTYLTLKC